MQIAGMEQDQIEALQKIERERGYLMPNWNIQQLFHIPTVKEKWGIPDKEDLLFVHHQRIEKEIARLELTKAVDFGSEGFEVMAWTHSFDWAIFNIGNKIIWEYSGPKSKKMPGRLQAILDGKDSSEND